MDCCTQVQFSSRVVQVPAPSGFSFGNVEVKDDHGHLQQYWYGLFYDCIFLKGFYCAKRFISNREFGESLIDYDEKVGVFNESGHLVLGESLLMVNIGKSSQENYYHKGEFWGDQAVTFRRGDVRICLPDQEILSIKNGVFNKLGEPVRDA